MGVIIGLIVVIGCILGGYTAMGGHLYVLWQPYEFVIIVGAALGAYIIANTGDVLKHTGYAVKRAMGGAKQKKDDYVELLTMLCLLFKTLKTKGILEIERDIEDPENSDFFKQFPKFYANKKAVEFLCDYMRLLSMRVENPHEVEALMDEDIGAIAREKGHLVHAMGNMAEGMPALGIVAAVLGVIKTMGAISEPPEYLGKLIGGALVGTFLGVGISYGFLGPLGSKMKAVFEKDMLYYHCIKACLIAHLNGSQPAVCAEFGRKVLTEDVQPTFKELDEAIQAKAAEQKKAA